MADLEEVTIVKGEKRSAVFCSSRELVLIANAECPELVGADHVIQRNEGRVRGQEGRLRRGKSAASRAAELDLAPLGPTEAVALS